MNDAIHSENAAEPEDSPETLEPSEQLDEDELGADPMERGVEPPDGYAMSDRHGTTASEQGEPEDLDHRLAEERPDVRGEPLERPVANTPLEDLDESIDDPVVPGEPADGENDAIAGEERPLEEELEP